MYQQGIIRLQQNTKTELSKSMYTNSIKVLSVNFPISYYNINSHSYQFSVDGTPITLTQGNYTANELCSHMETVITTAIGGKTFTCDYDSITGKITIVETSAANFTITWTQTIIRDMLGFTADKSGASTYTGTNIINLRYTQQIYLEFDELVSENEGQYNNLNIPNVSGRYCISLPIGALINDNYANFGTHYFLEFKYPEWMKSTQTFEKERVKMITYLTCKIFDQYGFLLELNGRHLHLMIEFRTI